LRAVNVPAHVAVLLGLSAGGYALSLAAVTGLQASSEAALQAERAPVAAAIQALVAQHSQLEADLSAARDAYGSAAAIYAASGSGFAEMEVRLNDLAAAVTEINGSASSLSAGAMAGTGGTARTAGTARTGSPSAIVPSQGTGSISVAAAAPLATVFTPVAVAPPPPPPPPTNTTTAASGAKH
jgi:hypothetical protein